MESDGVTRLYVQERNGMVRELFPVPRQAQKGHANEGEAAQNILSRTDFIVRVELQEGKGRSKNLAVVATSVEDDREVTVNIPGRSPFEGASLLSTEINRQLGRAGWTLMAFAQR